MESRLEIEYAYEITLLCVCVCLCILPIVAWQRLGKNHLIVARQRLGRNVTAVTNTLTTIEKLLDASFSMWPVSYQGKQAISSSQNFLFKTRFNNNPSFSSKTLKVLVPSGFTLQVCAHFSSATDGLYSARLVLLELMAPIILAEECKVRSSSS
jgi:hypothetical protein